MIAAQPQGTRRDQKLRRPRLVDLGERSAVDRRQVQPAQVEVDSTPVVGVYKRCLPQLASLIDVRHSWSCELYQFRRERVAPSGLNDTRDETGQRVGDTSVIESCVDERMHPLLEGFVGGVPVGRVASLARRLLGVGVQTFARRGPRADDRLPEQSLQRPVADGGGVAQHGQGVAPDLWNLGQHADAGPHVFATFRVVRRQSRHRQRETSLPQLLPTVEFGLLDRELRRVGSHLGQ